MPIQKIRPDKRTQILDAALSLIAENGFHGAPTSRIAEKAKVGVGSIYRYFKDKEELIHELFREVGEKVNKAVLRDHDPHAPLRQQYLHLCCNIFHYFVEHPEFFNFLEQYFHSPFGIAHRREELLKDDKSLASENHPPLHYLFEAAREQDIIKDLPIPVLGALTLGPITLLIRDASTGVIHFDADMVYRIAEACWDAIKR